MGDLPAVACRLQPFLGFRFHLMGKRAGNESEFSSNCIQIGASQPDAPVWLGGDENGHSSPLESNVANLVERVFDRRPGHEVAGHMCPNSLLVLPGKINQIRAWNLFHAADQNDGFHA